MGMDRTGILLLVVVYTFQQIDNEKYKIRIISTRKATRKETKQYREENIWRKNMIFQKVREESFTNQI